MKEQQIQSKIVKYLESRGAYVVKVVSATKAGVPDILACYKGKFLGVEVKTPKTIKNVSKLQNYNLNKIREAAGSSCVASNVDEVEEILDLIDKT